jgi:oxygen-independent coproporphyrinogen-3 oxidase
MQGIVPFEQEILTPTQQLNEYIMTGLRTMEGISIERIANQWGQIIADNILLAATQYQEQGHMVYRNPFLQLTLSGKFLADGIAADLFVAD